MSDDTQQGDEGSSSSSPALHMAPLLAEFDVLLSTQMSQLAADPALSKVYLQILMRRLVEYPARSSWSASASLASSPPSFSPSSLPCGSPPSRKKKTKVLRKKKKKKPRDRDGKSPQMAVSQAQRDSLFDFDGIDEGLFTSRTTQSPFVCASPPQASDKQRELNDPLSPFEDASNGGEQLARQQLLMADFEHERNRQNLLLQGTHAASLPSFRVAPVVGRRSMVGDEQTPRISSFRTVRWMQALGLGGVPEDNDELVVTALWKAVAQHRQDYVRLRAKYVLTPEKLRALDASKSVSTSNPLSTNKDSPWFQFFEKTQLLDMIRMDVSRTYSDDAYFQEHSTQTMLENVLLVWALDNPALSYRQGMNELVAIFLIALRNDKQSFHAELFPRHCQQTVADLMDEEFLEHDIYALFNRLMITMGPLYTGAAEIRGSPDQTPLFKKLNRIHHELLKEADLELYEHLEANSILPQLYLLRWVRVLFTREFTQEQILSTWDRILRSMALVDYVCIAMLVLLRFELLDSDTNFILHKLIHYPPTDDIKSLLSIALGLQQGTCDVAVVDPRSERRKRAQWGRKDMQLRKSSPLKSPTRHPVDKADRLVDTVRLIWKTAGPERPITALTQPCSHAGFLIKEGGGTRLLGRKTHKRRWFLLRNSILTYYRTRDASEALKKTAHVDLRGRVVTNLENRAFGFSISACETNSAGRRAAASVIPLASLDDAESADDSDDNDHDTTQTLSTTAPARQITHLTHQGQQVVPEEKSPDAVEPQKRTQDLVKVADTPAEAKRPVDTRPRRSYSLYAPNQRALEAWVAKLQHAAAQPLKDLYE